MRYLGKSIVAKGFKKLPKVQKIAQSGHTDSQRTLTLGKSRCTAELLFNFHLDSAALLILNEDQLYLYGQIQTSHTGGQLCSDTSPYGACSLVIAISNEPYFDTLDPVLHTSMSVAQKKAPGSFEGGWHSLRQQLQLLHGEVDRGLHCTR